MSKSNKVYFDEQQRGYIAGASATEVRNVLMYGTEQFKRYVRPVPASVHPLAARALQNPGGVYLLPPLPVN